VELDAIDTDIERRVAHMQSVIDLGRAARDKVDFSNRTPVPKVTVIHTDPVTLADIASLQVSKAPM
jgi:isoleucyl-tRNA synthetase